jgi:hypothetical protein
MDLLIEFFLLGGWILLVPAFVVLGMTAWVLIGNAVDRHRALQDGDIREWERHTTP